MHTDSFSQALSRLDPASRALLDLSLRRGMRPEEIGDLLGTDPESVIVARETALEQLASELGLDDVTEIDSVRARLAELPGDAWTGQPQRREQDADEEPEHETAAVARAPAERVDEPDDDERPAVARPKPQGGSRTRLPLLLALLGVAALALVAVLLARGGGDNGSSAGSSATATATTTTPQASTPSKPAGAGGTKTATTPAPPPARQVALSPVAGTAGAATASASLADGGKRLLLNVKGLPDPGSGRYQVWLYNSVIEARSIGAGRGRNLQMDLKLPAGASHYRAIDVSREPADGNPNHSGESVLRVPLSKLAR